MDTPTPFIDPPMNTPLMYKLNQACRRTHLSPPMSSVSAQLFLNIHFVPSMQVNLTTIVSILSDISEEKTYLQMNHGYYVLNHQY